MCKVLASNGKQETVSVAREHVRNGDVSPMAEKGFGPGWHDLALNTITPTMAKKKVRPEGLEPPTLGSEDRCSIQLSYGRKLLFTNTLRRCSSVQGNAG